MFILASSVCMSLQCLISVLTQGSEGGHLLGSLVQLCCEGGTLQANITGMCGECSQCLGHRVCPLLTVYVLSQFTLLRFQVALQGYSLKWALGCMHFPDLSLSGSGSCVLHKGADSVGPAFCALPRSEQHRLPGAW